MAAIEGRRDDVTLQGWRDAAVALALAVVVIATLVVAFAAAGIALPI